MALQWQVREYILSFSVFSSSISFLSAEICVALTSASLLHIATHATIGGSLVLKGERAGADDYLQAADIYKTFAASGAFRPDLVVLNTCVLITDSYLLDSVDGILRALLSCGERVDVLFIYSVSSHEFRLCMIESGLYFWL